MNIFGDDPNIVYIDDNNVTPEELIEDYTEALMIAETKKGVQELLYNFAYLLQYYTLRQLYINQAKENLGQLEQLNDEMNTFYEDFNEDE